MLREHAKLGQTTSLEAGIVREGGDEDAEDINRYFFHSFQTATPSQNLTTVSKVLNANNTKIGTANRIPNSPNGMK